MAGRKGPAEIRRLRDGGFFAPVLFDGCGYEGQELPPPTEWVTSQREAGADRLLLPGVYAPWDKDDNTELVLLIKEQSSMAADLDAGMLIAADARWIARKCDLVIEALLDADRPTALVLADRADPLAVRGAVAGLRRLAQTIPQLSILRSDHGALGAVAFGAVHASIGLNTSTRHFATVAMRARRLPGGSSRVFVRPLLDWFRASEIAGWFAAGLNLKCNLQCCNGAGLDRFLDDDLDATWHNLNALADFADLVLSVNEEDRAIEFLAACRAAASQYGLAGFKGPENPKAQLTGWALC
ncbi:MAG: hypothetical protein AB7L17_17580 [Ilumatobacteraceae bacterium]